MPGHARSYPEWLGARCGGSLVQVDQHECLRSFVGASLALGTGLHRYRPYAAVPHSSQSSKRYRIVQSGTTIGGVALCGRSATGWFVPSRHPEWLEPSLSRVGRTSSTEVQSTKLVFLST
jgi:hypothetical protein